MNKDQSNFFDIEKEKIEPIYREVQELSGEAETSLKEYFGYISSLRNRKSSQNSPAY
jgi:hypothetical protein